MNSFIEEMQRLMVSSISVNKFLIDRDRRFKKMNDKNWGPGNWIRCMEPRCIDNIGYPSYHHKEFHESTH